MTPKEQAAMQQALEALESYSKSDYIKKQHPKRRANGEKAITALREALAVQVEQEPVVQWCGYCHSLGCVCPKLPMPTANAAPVRTKDLTDDEIEEIIDREFSQNDWHFHFARAVIAAYKEKNK